LINQKLILKFTYLEFTKCSVVKTKFKYW